MSKQGPDGTASMVAGLAVFGLGVAAAIGIWQSVRQAQSGQGVAGSIFLLAAVASLSVLYLGILRDAGR